MKIPKFKVVDRRGDEPVTEKVSSIDFINHNICYVVNEYGEEEVIPFDDEDCELIEER